MTSLKPSLRLNRLVVTLGGNAVYDQPFHAGVNIIRGENSHGKSTIADLIFFLLGGDYSDWKPEALDCDYVTGEINVNGQILTIRRKIGGAGKQPLHFFFGTLAESSDCPAGDWKSYPYARTARQESFSQIFLKALDIPESRGDTGSTITMHQILRLLYVDQVSSMDALLRTEGFDSSLTRETIGDLLLVSQSLRLITFSTFFTKF